VSKACGCSEDLITPLNPALTFEVGKIEELASSIRQGLNDPSMPHQIHPILDKFSPRVSLESVTRLYTKALSN
jgi:hypothetical protein